MDLPGKQSELRLLSKQMLTHSQYSPRKQKPSLKLKIDGEEITVEGDLFSEATFISEAELPAQ